MECLTRKKPDLDNVVQLELTEQELLIITAAIRRISPNRAQAGVNDDWGVSIPASHDECYGVFRLCSDAKDILKGLGYTFLND